ncbi:MAG: DUF4157 domain-containing protein [Nitrosomonas sp.]|nr:DUF4157 domain-containing protein [Nitrosomonas sp.]
MLIFSRKPKSIQRKTPVSTVAQGRNVIGQTPAVRSILHPERVNQKSGQVPMDRDVQANAQSEYVVNTSMPEEVIRSHGQSLDPATRFFFEQRFGQDFSRVRVHTDAVASESAQTVNALAYTVKNNIVFENGQYAPETSRGRKLLAHELAHVLQQRKTHFNSPVLYRSPGEGGEAFSREQLQIFANDPSQALVRWPQLDSAERGQLLGLMVSRHGTGFVESFERVADSMRGPVTVRNYSDYRTVDRRRLESRGWNRIGLTGQGFDFWVHPSGGVLMVFTDEPGAAQPAEEPASEAHEVSSGVLPTDIEIPDDPVTRYGPVVSMSNTFMGQEADARLYANGTIEVYYPGSDNPITYMPAPGTTSFYQTYNEEGQAYSGTPVDIYREFPDYLAEELDL